MKSNREFATAVIALAAVVLGLMLVPEQGAIIALLIAAALLTISGDKAKKLMTQISWDTVVFLIGILGIVEAMVLTGVIGDLAFGFKEIIGTNVAFAVILMLWIPGVVMGPMDAKAVGVLLAPIAGELSLINPLIPITLTMGTNLGGYIVPLGDAPNIVAVSTAEKYCKPISWAEFNKLIIPLGLLHAVIATIYLVLTSFLFF